MSPVSLPLSYYLIFFISLFFSISGSQVRLVTLEMAIIVLRLLAVKDGHSRLKDFHFAMIEVGVLNYYHVIQTFL